MNMTLPCHLSILNKESDHAPVVHSAILLTCTKLPPVFKTFVLSIFERSLKTGFIVPSTINRLINVYIETCLKWSLKNRHNNGLKVIW